MNKKNESSIGYEIYDVKGTGNCYWRALSHPYSKNENYYQIFKDVTSDYLKNNL